MKRIIIGCVLFLPACVYHYPTAVSTTSLNGKYEKPLIVTNGESHAFYLFGIGPIGDDSLQAAIEDAQGDAPADTMINVFIDRKATYFPFRYFPIITRISTSVYGTLIKYRTEDDKIPDSMAGNLVECKPDELIKELGEIETGAKMKIRNGKGEVINGNAVKIQKSPKPYLVIRDDEHPTGQDAIVYLKDISEIQVFGNSRKNLKIVK